MNQAEKSEGETIQMTLHKLTMNWSHKSTTVQIKLATKLENVQLWEKILVRKGFTKCNKKQQASDGHKDCYTSRTEHF